MVRLQTNFPLRYPQVSTEALIYLKTINSPRADEFRSRLDSRFELSTIFKPSSELEACHKRAVGSSFDANDVEQAPQ